MKYRIFVLDDHPVMRRGYRTLINGEMDMEVCGEAATAMDALEKIPAAAPDLVIADITLEGINGIQFVKRLQTEQPGLDVLVVSMHEESLYAERALHAGAVGYLMKTEADGSVIKAIRRVMAGKIFVSDSMQEKVMGVFAGRLARRPRIDSRSLVGQLSDRELEVFELHGRGLSTRDMAEALKISHKTVATHRGRIKTKLAIESTPELVRRAVLWIENEKPATDGEERPDGE